MTKQLFKPATFTTRLRRRLLAKTQRIGLRTAGRFLGDRPWENRHAMRLYRMTRSEAALANTKLSRILDVCWTLKIPLT